MSYLLASIDVLVQVMLDKWKERFLEEIVAIPAQSSLRKLHCNNLFLFSFFFSHEKHTNPNYFRRRGFDTTFANLNGHYNCVGWFPLMKAISTSYIAVRCHEEHDFWVQKSNHYPLYFDLCDWSYSYLDAWLQIRQQR